MLTASARTELSRGWCDAWSDARVDGTRPQRVRTRHEDDSQRRRMTEE